jgi:NAD(P)-dependent dehydrogenase (short-subunit alcohol dehydrogenase family)
MYDLSRKVALVTGTSRERGMGRGIVLRLAGEGADVIVTDKAESRETFPPWEKTHGWRGLDSLVEEIEALGHRALAIAADITDIQQVNDMVEKAIREFGKIDILVNNAAYVTRNVDVVDMDVDYWKKTLEVNTTGTFLTCQAVAREMIKRGEGGKIVNISSKLGKVGVAGSAAYCASKFGVVGFTQTLALELGRYGINVNAICPGLIVTWSERGRGKQLYKFVTEGLTEKEAIAREYADSNQLNPLGRPGTVADIVNAVVFLVSNQSDYITGQAINVSGGDLLY